jgi:rhamnosyltransferase
VTSATDPGKPRVAAVVVAHRPDRATFAALLAALDGQVELTVVVDNGNGEGIEGLTHPSLHERLDMHGNAGVAAAQNAGIRHALARGATHVLFLDHDSVPAAQMVERLLAAVDDLARRGERVAAVGAEYRDGRHATPSPFVDMGWWGFRRKPLTTAGEAQPVSVAFLISAGSLVPTAALEAVGLMDERLFIDYVDVEWCLRARGQGWTCWGMPGAHLEHRLGDAALEWRGRPLRVLGRTLPVRQPHRHYFMFRNGVWLVLHGAMPLRWKLLESKRLAAAFAAFALFAERRGEQVRAMARGTLDGIRGRFGPA